MFVIVRHGNTFEKGEMPRRIGAKTDVPLTAEGERQAAALGRHFADHGVQFHRILTSPLRRTKRTAEYIAAAQGADTGIEEALFLREIDHGADEGKSETDVAARIGPHALAQWDTNGTPPAGWAVDRGARIAAWRDLFASDMDAAGPVLLVTSNGAARFALMTGDVLDWPTQLKLATGSFGILDRIGPGELSVRCWGERP